jgi:hypothetical protein
MDNAFRYIIGVGGLQTEASYPYMSGEGDSELCKADPSQYVAKISGFVDVTPYDETQLAVAVVQQLVSMPSMPPARTGSPTEVEFSTSPAVPRLTMAF